MTNIRCPKCRAEISVADLNIQEGVGFCRVCQTLTRLRDLAEDPELAEVDTSKPPNGCFLRDLGGETVVTASTRSIGGAIVTFAIAAFWNGIVSVFVLLAIGATLHHIFGSVPAWFPAPSSGHNDLGDSLGELIFLWLFLTPFIVIGLGMMIALLMCLMGRVEVRLRGDAGIISNGVGPICWTRRFDTTGVRSVGLGLTRWQHNDQSLPLIEIKTELKTLRFGTQLPKERRAWLAAVCRDLLMPVEGAS